MEWLSTPRLLDISHVIAALRKRAGTHTAPRCSMYPTRPRETPDEPIRSRPQAARISAIAIAECSDRAVNTTEPRLIVRKSADKRSPSCIHERFERARPGTHCGVRHLSNRGIALMRSGVDCVSSRHWHRPGALRPVWARSAASRVLEIRKGRRIRHAAAGDSPEARSTFAQATSTINDTQQRARHVTSKEIT